MTATHDGRFDSNWASGHGWVSGIDVTGADLDAALRDHDSIADVACSLGYGCADIMALVGLHDMGHRVAPTSHDEEVA